jgi:hypothetical protein
MTSRTKLIALVTLAALGAAALPCTAHAQGNRGELVSATAKLNQAQMALVKKLADDPAFAAQFDGAAAKGNSSVIADLVSRATGVSKGSISVQGNPGGGAGMAGNTRRDEGLFHLASTTTRTPTPIVSGEICFDFGKVRGCISF